MPDQIQADYVRSLLPKRPGDAHKYTFGRALVVAGSPQYPGAASLATASAARVGAGLVCLATGRSALGGPGRIPEITYLPLPEIEWGTLGETAADELLKKVGEYQALLIGPGIGREQPTLRFLERILGLDAPRRKARIGFQTGSHEQQEASNRPQLPPMVLDADALSLLSGHVNRAEEPPQRGDFFQRSTPASHQPAEEESKWWEHLPHSSAVLTPHAGEMARLLGVDELTGDQTKIAAEAAQQWGQVVVLKGPQTIIANAEGRTLIHHAANPALATAGTGDVLAGAITGFLAQGLTLFDAATAGVYIHSAAGRLVQAEFGNAGALASDLLPHLPLAIRELF